MDFQVCLETGTLCTLCMFPLSYHQLLDRESSVSIPHLSKCKPSSEPAEKPHPTQALLLPLLPWTHLGSVTHPVLWLGCQTFPYSFDHLCTLTVSSRPHLGPGSSLYRCLQLFISALSKVKTVSCPSVSPAHGGYSDTKTRSRPQNCLWQRKRGRERVAFKRRAHPDSYMVLFTTTQGWVATQCHPRMRG